MEQNRTDILLQYALLVAGQEDDLSDRRLGPIHLVKYVYLADLAYAGHHGGETYTGTGWRFHKFGPWCQSVNERIEPALNGIGADKQVFPSDFEDRDEWVRWQITDDELLYRIETELPLEIIGRLQTDIHIYGKDTPSLLSYVYRTLPMLSAAPGEYLDFSLAVEAGHEPVQPMRELTARKKKKLKEKMRELQEKNAARQKTGRRQTRLVNPVKSPRYDDVYYEGLKWLDSLAGPGIDEGEKEAVFDESVWKSQTRRGDDVSG